MIDCETRGRQGGRQGENIFSVPDQPAVGVYELASTPTGDTAPYEGPTCPRADVGSACPHGDVGSDPPPKRIDITYKSQ